MSQVQPRFEFRIWGEDLDDVASRVRSVADQALGRVETSETYLVVLDRDDINPKIRADLLDIKALVAVVEGFEQWKPWRKDEFPLSAEALDRVLVKLGGYRVHLESEVYSVGDFVDEVVRSHPLLHEADVHKYRSRYSAAGCLAEVADVSIDGHELATVAIESEDISGLAALRYRLGLEGHLNVNYPRAIKTTLGLEIP